jgi:hypothetical protein
LIWDRNCLVLASPRWERLVAGNDEGELFAYVIWHMPDGWEQ